MRNSKRWLVGILALVVAGGTALAQAPKLDAGTPQGRPRLIVLVVVDQLRAEYLERFAEGFGAEGFDRLKREGAYFVNCHYPYANTETGPGHATIATGATPNRHGIAANTWFDWARKRMVHAVFDDQQAVVSEAAGGEAKGAKEAKSRTERPSTSLRAGGISAPTASGLREAKEAQQAQERRPRRTCGPGAPGESTGGTPVPPKSEPSASPCNLMSSTLGDELKLATLRQGSGQALGKTKVYGISWKDRSAILASGKTADGAFWFDRQLGRFVSSTYYMDALPGWLAEFNRREVDAYVGRKWGRLSRTERPSTALRAGPSASPLDSARGKLPSTVLRAGRAGGMSAPTASGLREAGQGEEKAFLELAKPADRPGAYYEALAYTPYANELLTKLAERLIVEEGLGADEVTDLLAVGYSANDYGGHRWGPYSEEVEDLTLRTDAELARLLKFIEQRVGRGNYWVALSADHGVAPTLEQARARGIPAKNVAARQLFETMGAALEKRWGKDEWFMPRAAGVFNRETLERHGVSLAEAARVAGEAALTVEGVAGYVSSGGSNLPKGYAEAFELSEYPGRVGDIDLLLEPFALVDGERGGTSHGTPHSYDTHVPLLLWGAAFRAGVYAGRVTPADLAPTLAAALRITPPAAANGRALTEALREAAAGRRAVPAGVRREN